MEQMLEGISKLTRDLKTAAKTLSQNEARFLVDYYYQIQDFRISGDNQARSMDEQKEPHEVLNWLTDNMNALEHSIVRALDAYSDAHAVGVWAKSIIGIGPVLSAGLLAHIDVIQAPSVGHIWNFAGLNPLLKWLGREKSKELIEKRIAEGVIQTDVEGALIIAKELNRNADTFVKFATTDANTITKASLIAAAAKRPWNAKLKVLCWKIGESFVKVSSNPKSFYGRLYLKRKLQEQEKNDRLEFKVQAEEKLATTRIGKDTDAYTAYSKGKLPPAHIHARAKRYAVKLFLSHWHYFAYKAQFGKEPAAPYAIAVLGHADMLRPEDAT